MQGMRSIPSASMLTTWTGIDAKLKRHLKKAHLNDVDRIGLIELNSVVVVRNKLVELVGSILSRTQAIITETITGLPAHR